MQYRVLRTLLFLSVVLETARRQETSLCASVPIPSRVECEVSPVQPYPRLRKVCCQQHRISCTDSTGVELAHLSEKPAKVEVLSRRGLGGRCHPPHRVCRKGLQCREGVCRRYQPSSHKTTKDYRLADVRKGHIRAHRPRMPNTNGRPRVMETHRPEVQGTKNHRLLSTHGKLRVRGQAVAGAQALSPSDVLEPTDCGRKAPSPSKAHGILENDPGTCSKEDTAEEPSSASERE